jgi:hypothetical protein
MDTSEKIIVEAAGKAAAEVAGKTYDDLLHPSATEVGDVLGRLVHAVTIPIRGPLWCLETAEANICEGLEKRVCKIPEERRKMPDPVIAVPAIQSLQYTIHNDTLREMYLNLVANAMDTEYDKVVHPSYVGLIKNMSSLDAILFQNLVETGQRFIELICPRIRVKEDTRFVDGALPNWFIGETIGEYDYFDISASLVRLDHFGLINLETGTKRGTDYSKLTEHLYLESTLDKVDNDHPTLDLELDSSRGACHINEYGQRFFKAVIANG